MMIPKDAYLLRIHLGESDRWHGRPLYEAIVLRAREDQLAGAICAGCYLPQRGRIADAARLFHRGAGNPLFRRS